MNASLRLLRAFLAVSREGNVGRAAAALYVSQPSLSQDIRRLERELGVTLFDRSPKGLALTPAGEAFHRAAEAALAILDRGSEQARNLAAGERATISVGYSPSLGNKLVPELLPRLEAALPAWSIDVREVDTGEVGPGVAAGRFDVGLAHCPTADPTLRTDLLIQEPLVVAVGTNHPIAKRSAVRLAELDGSELMIWPRESASDYYDHIFAVCQDAGLVVKRVREFRRSMTRSYLFNEDDVFSVLPVSASFLHLPSTVFLGIEDEPATVPLMSVRRADDNRPELERIIALARTASEELRNTTLGSR